VKPRELGRDLGLELRMALALLLLVATYVGLAIGCAAIVLSVHSYRWAWLLGFLAVAISLARRYHGGGDAVLRAVGADVVPADAEHVLHDTVARLAALADVRTPRLAIAETDAANALAVGLRRRGSTIVVTRGLLDSLDPPEVEAVIAHEISHIAHRDAAVMTAVSAPRLLGEVVVGEAGSSVWSVFWFLGWPLGMIPLGIGTALTLTISRYREFAADRGSALLTGAPQNLMSALQKLAGRAVAIPADDLRAANAFCIVSSSHPRFTVFSDHPSVAQRLEALEAIARELGRPVG
jgi:heat shock protein HtpX